MSFVEARIGNIRITGFLGEGGMGKVYAGIDEKLRRDVALKALRGDHLDGAARARLLREARALSRLSHPNVCAIYDLIEAPEGDFLVLERIHGRTLQAALADGLAAAEKLRIAREIAAALVAAHAQGIVHRDLKLANVMLTDAGAVKVLDFGLARPSGEGAGLAEVLEPGGMDTAAEWTALLSTSFGRVVGTAACMSPEQARGEAVTTASDVYSLGLLFQELFTGRPPYPPNLPLPLLLIKAQEGDTLPVSGIDRDLAALLVRMKNPRPAERPTAVDVAHRLERIRGKPKRRLRQATAAAVVVLLVAGAVKYTLDLRRERDLAVAARAEAERARAESEEVARFLEEVFQASDPRLGKGGDTPARELLDQGARRVRTELRGQPLVRARLMGAIGRIYVRLGLFPQAQPLLEEALAVRRRELGPESLEVAQSLLDLGNHQLEQSRKQAEPLLRRALALREHALGPEDPAVAEVLQLLGVCLGRLQGDWKGAEPVLRRAASIRENDPRSPELAHALYELAIVRHTLHDTAEAERLFRRALVLREELLPPDHPDVASSTIALGVLLANADRCAEAIPFYRRGLASYEKRLGPEHHLVALTLSNLGICFVSLGDFAAAEPALLRSLKIREDVFGPDHAELVPSLWGLARLYRETGRRADLEAACARGLANAAGVFSEASFYVRDLRAWRAEGARSARR
ncbi:MAG TPA: hypothetical protein DD490_28140 [Acidobacteria bacterium]|nr:hypothetical protein [Acidobacteriota bacterium]